MEKMTFEQQKEAVLRELKSAFRPEFINRVDDIIVFNRLNEEEIKEIQDFSSFKKNPAL